MKVIVAGSRSIKDYNIVCEAIKESGFDITEVICGEAYGVDLLGKQWGFDNNIPVKSFRANWNDLKEMPCFIKTKGNYKYNALAGHNRNRRMAQYASQNNGGLIAITTGSSGTKNMIELAEKYKLSIYIKKI